MSNMQFYIAVAIPSILVVLSWIQSNSRANDLKESLQRQHNDLRASMDRQFEQVDRQFEQVDRRFEQINHRLDRIDDDLKHFHNVTGVLEGRIDEVSRK